MPSKYDPLKQYLLVAARGPVEMSFAEIERLLGLPLPRSARHYDAWWLDASAGTTHVQARAWLDAHRRVEHVDRAGGVVRFGAVRP